MRHLMPAIEPTPNRNYSTYSCINALNERKMAEHKLIQIRRKKEKKIRSRTHMKHYIKKEHLHKRTKERNHKVNVC